MKKGGVHLVDDGQAVDGDYFEIVVHPPTGRTVSFRLDLSAAKDVVLSLSTAIAKMADAPTVSRG